MSKNYLVIVDVQGDFLGGPLGVSNSEQVVGEIEKVLKNYIFDHVVCTLDTHDENYLKTKEGKHLPTKHCIKGTLGHKIDRRIHDALYWQNSVKYVEKHTFAPHQQNIFNDTGIYDKNDKIFICGVCTDICVISTALQLSNMYPECEIYLIEPCCAGSSIENHYHAIHVMESCQINIIDNIDKIQNVIYDIKLEKND